MLDISPNTSNLLNTPNTLNGLSELNESIESGFLKKLNLTERI